MIKKNPSSLRTQGAYERAQEFQAKAIQTLVSAYETENREIQQKLDRYETLDAELTELAIACGANGFGGGATGGNALKAIASRLRGLLEMERRIKSNEPSPEALAELEQIKQNNEKQRVKANTLDIWDALVMNISNWSTDFQVAPDIESAIQSVLFPLVYEQVADNRDYLLTEVPAKADDVLQRGRELVRSIRQRCETAVTQDQATWDEYATVIQEWVISDALPTMYEAAADDWTADRCFTYEQMLDWRDNVANRPTNFDKVFDITEVQSQHHERTDDLSEFVRKAMHSRIEPEVETELAEV